MNQLFVDSSVWIDHLRGQATPGTTALHAVLLATTPSSRIPAPPEIVVGDLVVFEVMRGVRGLREEAIARSMLGRFLQVTVGGPRIALAAAAHYRRLRTLGIAVRKSIGCLIAAWCIAHDVALLHSDPDFAPFEAHCGLRVFDPATLRGAAQ